MADDISHDDAEADDEEYVPTPWHFKLLLLALVLYLAFRLVQLVIWILQHV